MPKIIENLPVRLMEEARRQVLESGYGTVTIRSVARQCGVGVGTVYNYYSSKDALVAAFMLEDWKMCVREICLCAEEARTPQPVLEAIHRNLNHFCKKYTSIFRDSAAESGFSGSFSRYHAVLRSQLAAPLRRFCPDDFTADFIAEAMLVWTVDGKSFDELHSLIRRLL